MEILVKTTQLLLSLSILITVHELGHYFFARLFKTRVEKFYLFFNPWFSLYKKQVGETEYGLGWIPLGGYVKIAGMIDESMDKEQLKQPPQPHEYRSKKTWQRLFIMLGGIIVNLITAFVIYSMVLYTWGEEYLPNKNATNGISVSQVGKDIGLMNGDKVVSVNGKEIENFRRITHDIIVNKAEYVEVKRNGQRLKIFIPDKCWPDMLQDPYFIDVRIPFVITQFAKNSAGEKAGLKIGDKLVGVNHQEAIYFDQVRELLAQNKNKNTAVSVLRGKDTVTVSVIVPETGKLGLAYEMDLSKYYLLKRTQYNFLASIPAGVSRTFSMLDSYVKQFKLLFSPETKAYENMGGFIKIGSLFPPVWDWFSFWTMTAFLSVILAFMNLLPIPALDGGHVLFLLYEMVTGRKPSDKFLEYAQIVGMVIVFGLILWSNGNDILGLFK